MDRLSALFRLLDLVGWAMRIGVILIVLSFLEMRRLVGARLCLLHVGDALLKSLQEQAIPININRLTCRRIDRLRRHFRQKLPHELVISMTVAMTTPSNITNILILSSLAGCCLWWVPYSRASHRGRCKLLTQLCLYL